MRTLIMVLAVALLAGCSTSPISADKAAPVPSSRPYGFAADREARLVVTRDSGIVGMELRFLLQIDGKPAAEFHAGEVARFGIAPGKHVLGLAMLKVIGEPDVLEAEIEVKPGETIRRRISIRNGDFYLTPTAY